MNEEPVYKTEYGYFTVSADVDAKFAEYFKKGVHHQKHDIELLKRFITADSDVVDIGAHVGSMTVPFAQVARHVHSFEPVPATRSYLEKNIALNSLTNVTVHPYAAGNTGDTRFAHAESAHDAGQYTVNKHKSDGDTAIEVRRLDDEVSAAGLLKVDAEGMEAEVFEGGAELIKKSRPVIFCEINFGQLWQHDSSPARIESLLHSFGYKLYIPLSNGTLGRVWSISLLTGIFRPAFFLRISRNWAFDIVALPKEYPLQRKEVISSFKTVLRTIKEQAALKWKNYRR